MVIVLADHSMDWSTPDAVINLHSVFEADPLLAGRVADRRQRRRGPPLLDRGRPPATARSARMRRDRARHRRACWQPTDPRSCGSVPKPVTWSSTARRAGASRDPEYTANPIPGNHGHPATQPIPFFLAVAAGACAGVVHGAGAHHRRGSHARTRVRARRPARRVRRQVATALRARLIRLAGPRVPGGRGSSQGAGQLRHDAVDDGATRSPPVRSATRRCRW